MEYIQNPTKYYLFPVRIFWGTSSKYVYFGSDKALHLKAMLRDVFKRFMIPHDAVVEYEVAAAIKGLDTKVAAIISAGSRGYFDTDKRLNIDSPDLANYQYIQYKFRAEKLEKFLENL